MSESFPGTWYALLSWGSHPGGAVRPGIERGLEKIELTDVRTRSDAITAAQRLCAQAASEHGGFMTLDGTTYPHGKVVYAEDFDSVVSTTTLDDIPGVRYTLTVDYGRPLQDAIAAGNFTGYVNRDITRKRFPSIRTDTEKVVLEIVHPNLELTTEQVLSYLEENNLRPATLEEFLALTEKDQELGHDFPVVALGSFWFRPGGHCLAPYAGWDGGGRRLDMHWRDRPAEWYSIFRFVAVRK